jgi:hypothetical protein
MIIKIISYLAPNCVSFSHGFHQNPSIRWGDPSVIRTQYAAVPFGIAQIWIKFWIFFSFLRLQKKLEDFFSVFEWSQICLSDQEKMCFNILGGYIGIQKTFYRLLMMFWRLSYVILKNFHNLLTCFLQNSKKISYNVLTCFLQSS